MFDTKPVRDKFHCDAEKKVVKTEELNKTCTPKFVDLMNNFHKWLPGQLQKIVNNLNEIEGLKGEFQYNEIGTLFITYTAYIVAYNVKYFRENIQGNDPENKSTLGDTIISVCNGAKKILEIE